MTRACLNGQRSAKTEVLDSDGDSFQRCVYRDSLSPDLQTPERTSLFCMNLEPPSLTHCFHFHLRLIVMRRRLLIKIEQSLNLFLKKGKNTGILDSDSYFPLISQLIPINVMF